MNRTLKELEADLKTFAQSLVAGITDKPTVLLSKLGDKPIKYRIGIAVTGHPDETIKALITRESMTDFQHHTNCSSRYMPQKMIQGEQNWEL